LAIGLCLAPAAALAQQAPQPAQFAQVGGRIAAIRIEGTQRIDPTTVRSYMTVAPGDAFDGQKLDDSLKSLFQTGLFADVNLRREGDELVVTVVENPVINRIAFEGNKRIEDETLNREIELRPRVVYTRTRVQNDVARIEEIYRRSGRFAASITPKIIQLEQNRVDLVFEIDEGPKTEVRRINFVGNRAYDDDDLREAVQTKETRWYRFFGSDDTYDPDRLTYDRELLRRFYLSRGYADFRVVSAVAELTPDREAFFITFTVDEGERYNFGKVDVASAIPRLDTEALKGLITTETGDTYNGEEVERTITALTDALGNQQFAFVDIEPLITRNREEKTVDITYQINEGRRVYVQRININGNVRTLDAVIRREMQLVEGDPFNASRLKRSEQRIRDLGFFERVQVARNPGTAEDQTVIDVNVEEQSTGELSIGAGFSTADGPLGDISIRERNLLGRGQDLRLRTIIAGSRREIDLSFTEPYFLERDLSAGIDLFRITRDQQDESSYDLEQIGFGLRLGYPLAERLRQNLNYTLERNKIENVDPLESIFIREQVGSRVTSSIGQELVYDARDSRISPTEGYYLQLSNTLAGLGGDVRHLNTELGAGFYYPVYEQWILSLTGRVGYIVGIGQDVRINDRFFLGGDSLRGFATAGVGPRDIGTDDALGGNRYAQGSVEMSFPLPLPTEFGITGRAFSDFGTLSGADISCSTATCPKVADDASIRASVGVGLSWRSPLGPIRLDLAAPLLKEAYDDTEVFRFSFGTRF